MQKWWNDLVWLIVAIIFSLSAQPDKAFRIYVQIE